MHLKFEMLMLTLYFNTATNNIYLIYIWKFVKGEMSMLMLMIMLMLMVNINVNVNVNVNVTIYLSASDDQARI